MTRRPAVVRSILLILFAVPTTTAQGQWVDDGVPVTTAPGSQNSPALVPDGQGGVFVAWRDRNDPPRVFLQRMGSDGRPAAGWPEGGIPVPGTCLPDLRGMAADGAGGVILALGSCDNQVPYSAQRITGNGTIAPGWPPDGRSLGRVNYLPSPRGVHSDGAGGLYLTWSHDYQDTDPHGIPIWVTDYFVHRILASGEFAPGWPAEGVAIFRYAFEVSTVAVADGRGGLLLGVTTTDRNGLSGSSSLSRLNGSGTFDYRVYMACNTNGAEVRQILQIHPEASGGAIVHFREYTRGAGSLVHLTSRRFDAGGVPVGSWAPACQPFPASVLWAPFIVTDGGSGFYLGWEDTRISPEYDLYALRLNGLGNPAAGWAPGGQPVAAAAGHQRDPAMISDGMGGAILAWVDTREGTNSSDVYAQRLGPEGAIWPVTGQPICTAPGPQMQMRLEPDGAGGAYVCWADGRNGALDIYLHRIGLLGPVPVQVSVSGTEAMPDRVRVSWRISHPAGASFRVERQERVGEWSPRGPAVPDGTGQIEFVDRDVRAGSRYGFRLEVREDGISSHLGEVWVDVPRAELALGPLSPNPTERGWGVTLTLPAAGMATLEVIDLQGRVVMRREVRALGAGRHELRLDARMLPAGVYTLALRQGGSTVSARGVIAR